MIFLKSCACTDGPNPEFAVYAPTTGMNFEFEENFVTI
jgi:hypothetical protein